jgi:CHASE2 domain-containing sensor protein
MKRLESRWDPWQTKLQQLFGPDRWGCLTALSVAGGVILFRSLGLFQSLELAALDYLFCLRPIDRVEDRIVIVTVNDQDIQSLGHWPLSDADLAKLLQRIQAERPRVIGLDFYRDLSIQPGNAALQQVYQTTPNLVVIEKLADAEDAGVPPPPHLPQNVAVGFNNIVVDPDGWVRRLLLYAQPETSETSGEATVRLSFAVQVVLKYLAKAGIQPEMVENGAMQLGKAHLQPLNPNDGSYINADGSSG